jgi:hypothetical protein
MKITVTDILKNGIWLTFPPLLFSLSFMSLLPAVLTPDDPPLIVIPMHKLVITYQALAN